MNFFVYLRSLVNKFFRRKDLADDMEQELRSHIGLRADDLERSGLSREEAEHRARIEFGGRKRSRMNAMQLWEEISSTYFCRIRGLLYVSYGNPPVSPCWRS